MSDRPPPAASVPLRRFTLYARLWTIGLIVVVGALEIIGWFAVGLAVLAAGIIGSTVVFDGTRSWWGPEVQAYVRGRPTSGETGASRRLGTPLVLAALLIAVTAVLAAAFLLSQPR